MVTWTDLLIGLLPFALIAVLLWIRLTAAGASTKVAAMFMVKIFALVAVSISGLGGAVKGWREGNYRMLTLGAIVTIVGIIALRLNLKRMWEKFPLNQQNR